ncbi:hypothetical protein GEMRC1_000191 [Eukaryota sp. GEM-RC1]
MSEFPRIECNLLNHESITLPVPNKVNIVILAQKKAAYQIGNRWRRLCSDAFHHDDNFTVCLIRLSSKVLFIDNRHKSFCAELRDDEKRTTVVFYGEKARSIGQLVDNPDVELPIIYLIDRDGKIVETLSGSKSRSTDERITRFINDARKLSEGIEVEEVETFDEDKAQNLLLELKSKRSSLLKLKEDQKARDVTEEIDRLEEVMRQYGWIIPLYEETLKRAPSEFERKSEERKLVEPEEKKKPEKKEEVTSSELEKEKAQSLYLELHSKMSVHLENDETKEASEVEEELNRLKKLMTDNDWPIPSTSPIKKEKIAKPKPSSSDLFSSFQQKKEYFLLNGLSLSHHQQQKLLDELQQLENDLESRGLAFTPVPRMSLKSRLRAINDFTTAQMVMSTLHDEYRVVSSRGNPYDAHQVEMFITELQEVLDRKGWSLHSLSVPEIDFSTLTVEQAQSLSSDLKFKHHQLVSDLDFAKAQEFEVAINDLDEFITRTEEVEEEEFYDVKEDEVETIEQPEPTEPKQVEHFEEKETDNAVKLGKLRAARYSALNQGKDVSDIDLRIAALEKKSQRRSTEIDKAKSQLQELNETTASTGSEEEQKEFQDHISRVESLMTKIESQPTAYSQFESKIAQAQDRGDEEEVKRLRSIVSELKTAVEEEPTYGIGYD